MRVFLSHSSNEEEIASEVCSCIEANGHSCFLAPRDIRSGYEYAEEIINGIDNCDVMLLLLSESANNSPHVLREVERAVSKKKSIIVYKLEDVVLSKSLEYFLMTHQWLNAKPNKGHDEIIKCINEFAENHSDNPDAVPEQTVEHGMLSEKKKPSGRGNLPLKILAVVMTAAALVAAVIIIFNLTNISNAPESDPVVSSEAQNTNTDSTPSENTAQSNQSNTESKVKLGDSLSIGKYNGEPIKWRVIHISDDNKSAVVVSENILTMKAYDAAEGGKYNSSDGNDYWSTPSSDISPELQRLIRGDNRWELSNIRTWLNSAKENVTYTDQAPIAKAMSEHKNGYNTEPGFLNGFTEDELSVITSTEVKTGDSTTSDMVFLLSSDELQWLYDADVSIYAEPTQAAVEQDSSGWYKTNKSVYDTKDHFWWLRDADSSDSCKVHLVNISYITDERITSKNAGLEGYGIRPAMTIDLTAEKINSITEKTNEIN